MQASTTDFTPLPMVIDPEFKKLLPPMGAKAYLWLSNDIVQHGCMDTLSFWEHDGQFILLDGHARYTICRHKGLPFNYTLIAGLETREDAMIWILKNELGRRHLNGAQQAAAVAALALAGYYCPSPENVK